MKSLPAVLAGIVTVLVAVAVLVSVIGPYLFELIALAVVLLIAAVLFRRS